MAYVIFVLISVNYLFQETGNFSLNVFTCQISERHSFSNEREKKNNDGTASPSSRVKYGCIVVGTWDENPLCEVSTPLGGPVVPLEYGRTAGSSPVSLFMEI